MTHTARPVLIAGGGPVGSVLALALARSGIAVTLVDQRTVPAASAARRGAAHAKGVAGGIAVSGRITDDQRPIALSASSARILHTLEIWPHVAPRACPIQMVHVCEQGHFGAVRLRASEHGVPALGYVTDAAAIAEALASAVTRSELITSVCSTRVSDALAGTDHIHCSFATDNGHARGLDDVCDPQLLVVADGGHSSLCANVGIVSEQRDYLQSAVVCTVSCERAHQGVAYERFTTGGPLALLPMACGDCALVWSLSQAQAQEVAALDDAGFARALQHAFGRRLGRLHAVTARAQFPLSLLRAQQLSTRRVVVIGNAANRLHPVAGQGLNLGLRDAAVLADLVANAVRMRQDAGGDALLRDYARQRRAEHRGIVCFTDVLARAFGAGPPWLGCLRSVGMLALDLLPLGRHVLARHTMGLGTAQARLLRGLNP